MTPTTTVTVGAARAYTSTQLAGPTTEQESFPLMQSVASSIVGANGDRVGLLIVNLGTVPVAIALNPAASLTSGIIIGANGGVYATDVRDDYTLPSRQFFGATNVVTNAQLYVLEIISIIQNEAA